ncbi:MAG: hypothetical protein AB7O59_06810 [Pirellulales bacterium]
MRDSGIAIASGMVVWAALAAALVAQEPAAFVPPVNSLQFEKTGTLEISRSDFLQIRDDKMELWLLKLTPETTVSVEGEAEVNYLRPGVAIQFQGKVDKNSTVKEPITEIELLSDTGKPALGLFAVGEEGVDIRPVRNAGPGEYLIKGKLSAVKGNQLTVSIGGRRIVATLDEPDKVTIKYTSTDPSVAEAGDTVQVKAWYYDNTKPIPAMNIPGKAVAEEVGIKLAKPLAPVARRTRRN